MKRRLFAFAAVCMSFFHGPLLTAQSPVWQPSAGHTQLPLWNGPIPHERPNTGPETLKEDDKDLVGGKPWFYINSVTKPTITVYSPKQHNTGAAVLVYPGGGFWILAIDLEGTEVCDWLTTHGITCVLVKYRVPGETKMPRSGAYPESSEALDDAQRAISLVRFHAAEWHIDPHKIGVLGFSAGGHLVAATSVHFQKRVYSPTDAIDQQSCRPDFAVALYPGHLSHPADKVALTEDIQTHITAQTPPTFILQNEDDPVDPVENSISYFEGLKKAGVPTEMHIYAQGKHAFGLRPTQYPSSNWPSLMETWLATIHMIPSVTQSH